MVNKLYDGVYFNLDERPFYLLIFYCDASVSFCLPKLEVCAPFLPVEKKTS